MIAPPRKRLIYLALAAWLSLSGCGQKGDLYLPDEDPATTPAEQNDDAEEDSGT